MAHTPTRFPVALAGLALVFSFTPPATAQAPRVKAPVPFSSLTKAQLQTLGDNDPIEFQGKVTTKATLLAPLRNARVEADAELKIKLAQSASKLETLKVRSASLHSQQVGRSRTLVTGELAKLKQFIPPAPKATPTPCAGPVVAGVIGLVTPNSDVLVLGHCFGTQQGSASLQGNFGNVNLIIIEWHDGGIGLHIPSSLSGGPDQLGFEGAQIVIATANGQHPPVAPRVDFHAAREHRLLAAHEVKTQCSIQADINNCDPVAGRTLDAAHSNTIDVTSDTGDDTLSADLKNGWVIVEQTIDSISKGNFISPCTVSAEPIPASPTGHFSLRYHFNVSPFQYCRTVVLLYAEGPVGTSPH
ncbi:MAG: hypothetical protein PT977_03325 [Acidobacteriota bacterium]|nr:hypothetical protein [Acidobacteriota bacterium]